MPGDYPDWTDLIQIIGADIMVPIDIQGAYIMMPVDIQAQYVNLDIDIVAQSIGNIAIDLVAQSVGAITVDITAQTIGNLDIEINAQNVGVYLQPDWNVREGTGKAWAMTSTNKDFEEYVEQTYEVPAGKTLYITFSSCAGVPVSSVYANEQKTVLMDQTGIYLGGNGGCQLQLFTPMKLTAGMTMTFRVYNQSEHLSDLYGSIRGYEV